MSVSSAACDEVRGLLARCQLIGRGGVGVRNIRAKRKRASKKKKGKKKTAAQMKKVMIPSLDMKKSISVKVDSDLTLLLSSGVYEIKKMEPRRRLRPIAIVCLFLTIAGIIGFGYFCPDQVGVAMHMEFPTALIGANDPYQHESRRHHILSF